MTAKATSNVQFVFERKNLLAHGRPCGSGFVVEAGSTATENVSNAFLRYGGLTRLRDSLLSSGVLTHDGDHLRFTKDYEFASPSTAAAIVCGTPINGRLYWKTKDGVSLKDTQHQ